MIDLHHLFNVFKHDGERFRHFFLEKMQCTVQGRWLFGVAEGVIIEIPSVVREQFRMFRRCYL